MAAQALYSLRPETFDPKWHAANIFPTKNGSIEMCC